ncbi:MAG: ABC transporter permease [Deltaproteobacteria bacterium]|nr:ABC transporter permease [Deltaproteobacteria bacterium]
MKSFAKWLNDFRATTSIPTAVERLGRSVLVGTAELGEFLLFARSFFSWLLRPPFRRPLFFRQFENLGIRSLPIILLTATFTGMVFALEVGFGFQLFHAESLVGATVGLALSREIAPVFTALMVVARVGSSMAAEIGTMQVTEQVEAMSSMAVSPVQYLVVPRVVAGTLMVPCLAALYCFVGVLGAYVVAVGLMDISHIAFIRRLTYYVDADDFVSGLLKAAVFGFVLTLISCFKGYRTTGGAEGVGRATTQAVVVSSVTILILDYFLTSFIIELFPEF